MAASGVAIASVIAQWSGFLFIIFFINRYRSRIGIGRLVDTRLFITAIRDCIACCRFFILGQDIFIRTALLVLCEAMVLNQAAKSGDLDLATCQLVLTFIWYFSLCS